MITTLLPVDPESVPVQLYSGGPVPAPVGAGDLQRLQCAAGQLAELATALHTDGPRLHVSTDAIGVASGMAPDWATLARCGVECIEVSGAPDCERGWLRLVAMLVAGMEYGIAIGWQLPPDAPSWVTPRLLGHLAPPSGSGPMAENWQENHRFGMCHWRKGAGFIAVRDGRAADQLRYVIDEPPMLAAFTAAISGCSMGDLAQEQHTALLELIDADLAVAVDGLALVLPYRLRRRPMPADAI